MRMIKKWQLLTLLLINAVTFNACSNTSGENNQTKVNNNVQRKIENAQQIVKSGDSPVQAELDKAKKAGKVVFVVVTGTGSTNTDQATAIAKSAKVKYTNSVIVQMNKDDAANANLVRQWRLAGAPLPLILVISPKGSITGGLILSKATADKLVQLIPSPKMDDVYSSINNRKPVFIVVSKESYTDRKGILKNCKTAITQLKNNASIVEIDLADTEEQDFLTQLNLKNTSNSSSVVVLNASGQLTGTFESNASVTSLVAAASKVIRSSCCAGGGSCSPKK